MTKKSITPAKTDNDVVIYKLNPEDKIQLKIIAATQNKGMSALTSEIVSEWVASNKVTVSPASA